MARAVLGGKQSVRILVIQLWTIDVDPVERSLRDAGIDAVIIRVDFAAALDAALTHDRFDVVIYNPSASDLSREAVESYLQQHGRVTPVAVLDDIRMIGGQVANLLASRRN